MGGGRLVRGGHTGGSTVVSIKSDFVTTFRVAKSKKLITKYCT